MAENSKLRMNLVAIKKVDPYARDIVDSSSHVAFYTFNPDKNEWEKTDVEGAFFIYSRNAAPYHSIFIINRLNTSSFVEPITQLELQSQPPFLLYRNERSRIRGFWFYNSDECDRISSLVSTLVEKSGDQCANDPMPNAHNASNTKQDNVNLFKMLSDAQKEFSNNSGGNIHHQAQQLGHNTTTTTNMAATVPIAGAPSNKVLEFFASAKPTTVDKKHLLANTLSVEQIEQQQRTKTNEDDRAKQFPTVSQFFECPRMSASPTNITTTKPNDSADIPNELAKFLNSVDLKHNKHDSNSMRSNAGDVTQTFRNLLCAEVNLQNMRTGVQDTTKPALMPPTMFEKSVGGAFINNANRPQSRQEPLNATQFVEAFNYLMQNDDEFVNKLHAAYLQVFSKTTIVGTYQ